MAATSIEENGITHLTGTITDPGTPGHLHPGRELGRGRAETSTSWRVRTSFDVTHQYLDDNPTATPADAYTVNLTVTDDDTGEDMDSTTD